MCGIAGIVKKDLQQEKYQPLMQRMMQTIVHRGPDEQNLHSTENYCFGHVRLSIVDLEGGKQPMIEGSTKNTIVFNGEIYGFKRLKKNFPDYPFQTQCDTELLLAMYGSKAEKMLDELPGMFSFAIWDDKNKRVFAARDRFGEKPFYYAFGKNGEFIFASELKAIIASGLVEPVLDVKSLSYYLKRLYVPPNKTIYKNIHTLPPAHALFFADGKPEVWKYWNLPEPENTISFSDAKQEFIRLLNRSVEDQLVADVPVAAFLSGGLDSSTIVAIASQYKKDLTTFSFGFQGEKSELKYAEQIARKYNTNHIILEEKNLNIAELLVRMHEIYDEPFADSSNIPTYLISKLARKHGKVVLTGDGCDELMAGYNFWYRRLFEFQKAGESPKINLYFAKLMRSVSYRMKSQAHDYYHRKVTAFEDRQIYASIAEIDQEQKNFFDQKQLDHLFHGADHKNGHADPGNLTTLTHIFNEDIINYLAGDILVKTDRASMANSLELRAPFLDKEFAEFCISLPENYKITDKKEKYLMREACSDLWTEDIAKRPKQGFAASVQQWLNIPEVHSLKEKFLKNKKNKLYEILDHNEVMRYYDANDQKTWVLLNLFLWAENQEFSI